MSEPENSTGPDGTTQGSSAGTAALRRAAERRTTDAEKAAEKGIRLLLKDGGQISFAAVARASGVSKSFLHAHPGLSVRIRDLSGQQRRARFTAHDGDVTGESAVIAALRRHISDLEERHKAQTRELRQKVRDQERQIAMLYGKLRT